MPVRAVTFDYWDTLYAHEPVFDRLVARRTAVHQMLAAVGHEIAEEEFFEIYRVAHDEAESWWREGRAYTTDDRIRWMLKRLAIERPADCEHVAKAIRAIDDALFDHPPALLPGVGDALARLTPSFTLGIISDTGFGSGKAQNRVLERDQLLGMFAVTIYSMDVGHAKPRREPFDAAVKALGVPAGEIVHVGDNERTDIRGALAAGLRAVRVDIARSSGQSVGEFVARTHEELADYLLSLR
ncbi:MAG TPA: HAD family hydrolase [Gemmatimonadaceae bacterium]|nr:HAD family hydrolase [Gemmatimonadaceae bacterium]